MKTNKAIVQWFEEVVNSLRREQLDKEQSKKRVFELQDTAKKAFGEKFSVEGVNKHLDEEKEKLEGWIQNITTNVQPKFLSLLSEFPESHRMHVLGTAIHVGYDIGNDHYDIQCYWMHDQFLFYKNRKQSSKQELVDALKHTI